MFSKISWNQFITTILFLAWVYYTAVIVLFYRKDILRWFAYGVPLNNANKNPTTALAARPPDQKGTTVLSSPPPGPMSYNEFAVGTDEQKNETKINYAEVHELMEELKTIFATASKKKIIKQELMLAIQNKLNGYTQIKGTEIEQEIIMHIENECKEKCSIELSNEELKKLWKA